MSSAGDLVLFAITATGPMSWRSYSRAYDALLSDLADLEADAAGHNPGRRKRRALALLDALGHCEMVYSSGSSVITAAPAVLARLPLTGFPKAVLAGARQPSTIPAVIDACTKSVNVSVSIDDPSGRVRIPVPTRVELQAESDDELGAVARRLGIAYLPTPPAWLISSASATLDDVLARLEWKADPELNWVRREFDPQAIRFTPSAPSCPASLRLTRYQHRVKPDQLFLLWRGEESARIDARWGRYAVLAAANRRVLLYDEQRHRLAVPAGAPLPRLLGRALCLCSGWPPDFVPATLLRSRQAGSWGVDLYSAVSPEIADCISEKAGQRLWPVAFPHRVEAEYG
jgi:hypothetical protein